MAKNLLSILKDEVKPALGCTGPIVVSLAASKAKKVVGGSLKSVKVILDRDTYKGSLTVGIPGTSHTGLDVAAALGAIAGNSDLGLEVLKNITKEDEKKAMSFLENVEIIPDREQKSIRLKVEAFVKTDKGEGHVVIYKTHDNFVFVEANGEIIYKKDYDEKVEQEIDYSKDDIRKYGVKDFFQFVNNVDINDLLFLRKAIELNKELSKAGMEDGIGASFGRNYKELGLDTIVSKAKALTTAGSDARMDGVNLPAMSCATSGNAGIASSLPIVSVASTLNESEEKLLRALALSFLLTITVKSHIGRLSSICSCSIAASIGVTSGTVLLLGGGLDEINLAINTVGGGAAGIVCDGAKLGCSMKLSSGIGVAIESALLAMKKVGIPSKDGLVGKNADDTINNIGRIAREGMYNVPDTLFDIMINRS